MRRVVFSASTRLLAAILLTAASLRPTALFAQEPIDAPMIARIRDEGLNRSQAQKLYLTLSDSLGSRLTGSPEHKAAATWARNHFAAWGLADAKLDPFAFSPGWTLEKISVEMIKPRYMPLIAYPEAWSPSTAGVLTGRAFYVGDKQTPAVQAMAAQLKGGIVLTHLPQAAFIDTDRPQPGLSDDSIRTGNPASPSARQTANNAAALLAAGAGVTLKPSAYRDGTVGVLGNQRLATSPSVPSIVVAAEQYNMLARLTQQGVPVELRVELRTRTDTSDPNTYNVIAEIPGTDPVLRNEVVLVGAHLDSWHTANGATDNGDGAIAVLETARILAAVGARPRRTIRFALWSGEEQGLLGANAYIAKYLTDQASKDRLAVYLNDDPGSGKTLGWYMEGNRAAKAIFDAWLHPLKDLGLTRNIIEGIGSTDHVSFNQAGVPGFNVIKDFDAYDVRTRHSNADYPERMTEDELKQQSVVLAVFAWHAAQRNERIPRATRP